MKKLYTESYISNLTSHKENHSVSNARLMMAILLSLFIAPMSFSATPYCSNIFQNGLQTHGADGSIVFGKNSRIVHTYDTRLNTPTLTIDSSSALKTCGKQQCSATGVSVDGLFIDKKYTGSVIHVAVPDNQLMLLGDTGVFELGQISLGNNSIATFLQSDKQYTVDHLILGSRSTLRLPAGTYWINHFTAQANAKIEVVGEGQVTLFVEDNFSLPLNFKINENTKDPSRISIYTFGSSGYGAGNRIWAFIRSQTSATLKNKAQIYGGLLANTISLEATSIVDFDADAVDRMSFNYFCSGYVPYVDVTPPQINVVYPTDTSGPQATLTGTIKDPGGVKKATISYGNTELALALVNDQFSIELPLDIGKNIFSVEALDSAGNYSSLGVFLTRKSIPGFEILYDYYETFQIADHLDLSGTINTPEGHTIKSAIVQTASGELPLQLDGNKFSVTVPLVMGYNEYTLIAVDQYGNKALVVLQAGGLEGAQIVNYRIEPWVSDEPVREITGEIHSFWPMESLVVTLEDEPLELIRVTGLVSRFHKTVTLAEYRHRFDLVVKTPNGETTYEEYDVWYTPDRINLEINPPEDFSGTTENDTIVITGFLHLTRELIGVVTSLVVTTDQLPGIEIPIDLIPTSEYNSDFSIKVPLALGKNRLLFKTKQGAEDYPGGLGWSQAEMIVTRLE